MEELGILQALDPSTLWRHEAHEFTPWLLKNADGLAESLQIDLELTAAEHRVGTFSLDIIGRDLTHGTVLMVENQLAGTDHSHLGQVLTYAAGTGASTIVWIATSFRDEHRQALDWLNEQTSDDTHFFGVELQAFQIGNSLPAPHFKVVAEPNDWQKVVSRVANSGEPSGKSALYVGFWDALLERINEEEPSWTRRQTGQSVISQNWIDMPSPLPGTYLGFSFARGGRLRSELYFSSGDETANAVLFQHLLDQRLALEEAYGRPLEFEPLGGRVASRIAEYADGDISNGSAHQEYIEFFMDAGQRLRRALARVSGH